MKAPALAVIALVAVALTGIAQAGPGPLSPLYLTTDGPRILVVQGNSVINTFPEAYGSPKELPIAVWGDVRTTGYYPPQYSGTEGGQYTLGGSPTGTTYILPLPINQAEDSTSDGSHNYLVDLFGGTVYQTARDFTNPIPIFSTGVYNDAGISYDAANNSLWISGDGPTIVADYSLSGTLLSSFNTGHQYNKALALDPADHTLWLVNDDSNSPRHGYLEQYSTAGVLLSTGPYVGVAYGGEFDLAANPTPEPGTLIMFGSGILGLAGVLRRKINL